MEKDFRKKLYWSRAWKDCRVNYIKSMPTYKRGLCERCYSRNEHVLGEELHHKIKLTPQNIDNPRITLNHDNLILLCKKCHDEMHYENKRQYKYDAEGNILPL